MAVTENTLILETTQGPVTIEMRPDLAPNHVARIKELAREVDMPLSVFKYQAERGLSYSTETLARIADDIEHVVAMKTSCGTCADYYQVWNALKGKLSIFVTGGDTVDMLGMMMIGFDGAQAGIMAIGRENWSKFIAYCQAGKYTEARNIYIEKCAPIADHIFGAPLRTATPTAERARSTAVPCSTRPARTASSIIGRGRITTSQGSLAVSRR